MFINEIVHVCDTRNPNSNYDVLSNQISNTSLGYKIIFNLFKKTSSESTILLFANIPAFYRWLNSSVCFWI